MRSLILVGLLLTLPLFANGQKGKGSPTLKVASYLDPGVIGTDSPDAARTEAYVNVFKAFEKESGIKVEFITLPYDQLESQLFITNRAGKPAADVWMLATQKLASLVRNGDLYDLDDLVAKNYTQKELDDIVDLEKRVTTYQGKKYLMLAAVHTRFLYYNKDLVPNPPTNWQELLEIGKGVTDEANHIYGLSCRLSESYAAIEGGFAPIIWSTGGHIADENGYLDFNTPEIIEALNFIKKLAAEKVIPEYDFTDVSRSVGLEAFRNGKLGMYSDGIWQLHSFLDTEFGKRGKLGIISFPGKNGPAPNFSNGWGWGIASKSKNIENAFALLKYLKKPEVQKDTIYYDGGLPTRKSAYQMNKELSSNPYYRQALEIFNKYGRSMDPLIDYQKELEIAAMAFSKVLLTDGDPQQILDEAVKSYNK